MPPGSGWWFNDGIVGPPSVRSTNHQLCFLPCTWGWWSCQCTQGPSLLSIQFLVREGCFPGVPFAEPCSKKLGVQDTRVHVCHETVAHNDVPLPVSLAESAVSVVVLPRLGLPSSWWLMNSRGIKLLKGACFWEVFEDPRNT